jgi:PAS domain S-box-containing protein
VDNLEEIARQAVQGAALYEHEVRDNQDTWYMMRARPYQTWDGKTEGAVISFQDVDILKRTLDQTKAYADTLIETAREAILILDGELRVVAANRAFYDQFKVTPDQTEKRLVYSLGDLEWDIPALRKLLGSMIRENRRIDDFEVQHTFDRIGEKVMLLNARLVEPENGLTLILLSIEDVTTERRQREAIRRQATLLDLAHDAVIVRDIEGNIQFWNRGAEEMYGWKKEEALGKTTHEILRTVFPKPFEEIKEDLQRTGHWEGELAHATRHGERKFVRSRWAYLEQASALPVILEINTDISEQKQYEESLRQLSGHLMRVQDEERRRIARELHDSTGQKLAAARMFLDAVSKTSSTKSDKRISETVELIDAAFQDIRTLSQILHPPLLDEAGLISATRSMVDSFAGRAKIAVEFRVPEDFGRLSQAIELALFRVIQESLTNIHRHSGASEAKIELAKNGGGVTLEIRDNGKGLRPDLLSRPDGKADGKSDGKSDGKQILGVGILGMKERLSQLGGTLKINSGKQGTVVKATLPKDEKQ